MSRLQVHHLKLRRNQSARALLLQRSWRGHWCRRCMLENLQRKYEHPLPASWLPCSGVLVLIFDTFI
jgi:hypothetical protein